MFSRLHTLSVQQGFAPNSKPFFVGEVIDHGNEAISAREYHSFSTTTEFRYSNYLTRQFGGHDALRWLNNFGEPWGLHPSNLVLTFVENHDNGKSFNIYYHLILILPLT